MAIDRQALRFALYRTRCTWSARWTGYLTLVLLLGLVGGVAIGSVAAARRTQAAFPVYLASTNPSDLTVLTGLYGVAGSAGYDPGLIARIAALRQVRHVSSYVGLNVAVLVPGQPPGAAAAAAGEQGLPGSLDGEFFGMDKLTVIQGRMPDAHRGDEAVIDAYGGPSRVHVGSVAPLGFFTNAQVTAAQRGSPGGAPSQVKPYLTVTMKVVGKAIYSSEQAQDDTDTQRDGGPLFTPALTSPLTRCCAHFTETAVQLAPGSSVAVAERDIQRLLPKGFPVEFYVAGQTTARAGRAVEPTSIALAVFGAIAALAALIIAGQVIGRQLRLDAADLSTLRALGAGPPMTTADGLPGVLGAVAGGALLAGVVAVGLSPIAPFGAIRAVYPYHGVAFDWTVLGGGVAAMVLALSMFALAVTWRRAPHRAAVRGRLAPDRPSAVVRATVAAGLPVAAVEGVRLALARGAERDRVPVRPAIVGTVLAMVVLLATVTFGSSLLTLVSNPALYGWNWTYSLSSGVVVIDKSKAAAVLDHDPQVEAWTGIWYGTATIDRQTVPVIGASPAAPVAPPVLSGSGMNAADQIVLGAGTLAALGKRIGDTVKVTVGGQNTVMLRIVGTATLPSLGIGSTVHTEMGSGAVLPYQVIPGAAGGQPNMVLVTLRPGANLTAQRAVLRRIVPESAGGSVSPVQHPAEIVDYRAMGAAPAILALALALGALSSLWLTLYASVRRRRAHLALLKTLGFTRRQLAATVAWQSFTAVTVGAAVGAPLGIALGRFLWTRFARQLSVIPEPTIPAWLVVAILAAALVTAALIAIAPGRAAARTPAADLLRTE
jgi:putative ABC transport system permease protein